MSTAPVRYCFYLIWQSATRRNCRPIFWMNFWRETVRQNGRFIILSLRQEKIFSLCRKPDLLPAAKNSSGYYFNPVYNIMTDLERFDELYNNIMEGGNTPRNYLSCMQMMAVLHLSVLTMLPCRSHFLSFPAKCVTKKLATK